MNNKLFTSIITAFIVCVFSCNNNFEESQTILYGKIINPIGQKLTLKGPNYPKASNYQWEIEIDKDGNFRDTINLSSSSYYFLYHGRERAQLFLDPGDILSISLNTNEFDESISFSGTGSENNKFLKEKFLSKEESPIDVPRLSILDEKGYLSQINSIKQSELEFIKNNKEISKNFREIEKKNTEYTYLQYIQRYPLYNEFYGKKQPVYSDSFMKPLESIDYTNEEDYKLFPSFKQLVITHYQDILEKSDDLKKDFSNLNLSKSNLIKRDLVSQGVYMLSAGNAKNKDIYESLIHLTKEFKSTGEDSLVSSKLDNKFNVINKLELGMKSPEFIDYENFKGGTTSLSDLKGKYVYIDVWATWCGPCIAEIPSLKKVEKLYHNKNIEFVSISIDERNRPNYNYKRWKEMIVEKDLGGVQLFADNAWNSKFTKAYGIDSIPRFLLIDPDGNIVSGNAPRPSDQKLIELFDSLDI